VTRHAAQLMDRANRWRFRKIWHDQVVTPSIIGDTLGLVLRTLLQLGGMMSERMEEEMVAPIGGSEETEESTPKPVA
jgi:hypothetical protein